MVIEESGVVAGEIGLSRFDERPHTAVVGYWVAPWARGKGLAARSLMLALEWATFSLDLRAALALTHVANTGSVRTLERCGFGVLVEMDEESVVYAWRSGGSRADAARSGPRAC
jgi:RimJ/RimL family protein N-acetyltransferase